MDSESGQKISVKIIDYQSSLSIKFGYEKSYLIFFAIRLWKSMSNDTDSDIGIYFKKFFENMNL